MSHGAEKHLDPGVRYGWCREDKSLPECFEPVTLKTVTVGATFPKHLFSADGLIRKGLREGRRGTFLIQENAEAAAAKRSAEAKAAAKTKAYRAEAAKAEAAKAEKVAK